MLVITAPAYATVWLIFYSSFSQQNHVEKLQLHMVFQRNPGTHASTKKWGASYLKNLIEACELENSSQPQIPDQQFLYDVSYDIRCQ